jgi:hypothetical protein
VSRTHCSGEVFMVEDAKRDGRAKQWADRMTSSLARLLDSGSSPLQLRALTEIRGPLQEFLCLDARTGY